jgi:acetyl-CoA carboxylase carboxyl transferase subunit alpha
LENAADAERAAKELRLTANDLFERGIADMILKEPIGGAHFDCEATVRVLDEARQSYKEERERTTSARLQQRYERLRRLGEWGLRASCRRADN